MPWTEGLALTPANLNNISGLVYNVKDPAYGAVGDGVTNDTAAIQAAIDAAASAGDTVWLPGAVYLVDSHITFATGVSICGSNATIRASSSFGTGRPAVLVGSAVSNFKVSGVIVDANRGSNTGTPASGFFGNCIQLDGCRNVVIERCRAIEAPNHGIHVAGNSQHVTIRANETENTGLSGIQLHWRNSGASRPQDCIVDGNFIYTPCRRDSEVGAGMWLATIQRCRIVNNSVIASGYEGIRLFIGDVGPDASENLIAGNAVFSSAREALRVEGNSGSTVDGIFNNTFVGNSYSSNVTRMLVNLVNGTIRNTFVGDSMRSGAMDGVDISAGVDGNTFSDCRVIGCAEEGWRVIGGDFNTFTNCVAEANTLGGLQIGSNSSFNAWFGGRLSGLTDGDSRQSHAFNITASAVSNTIIGANIAYNANQPVDLGGGSLFALNSGHSRYGMRIPRNPPPTAGTLGTPGDLSWDVDSGTTFLYLCHSTNSWARVAVSPW